MMRFVRACAVVLAVLAGVESVAASFDDDFTGKTMRVDFYHTGTATQEFLSLDRVRIEGPWPGSRTQLFDPTGFGKYLVELVDLETNLPLYSRGFASIYGEWETTGEAGRVFRTLPEAVRVPEPRRSVQLRLRKRVGRGFTEEIWSISIDPASRFVDRAPVGKQEVWTVHEGGDSSQTVDLLILGDGYTADEMSEFRSDARRLTKELFAHEPFRGRMDDFNVRAIDTPSEESGICRPRSEVFRESPLGARYNSFDSERYVLTYKDRAWRDVAAAAPYDTVVILVNERKYGGGGIYNLYATVAAHSSFSPYLFVHEFGHSFASLGDEYYTSDVSYESPDGELPEPGDPNLTALHDPAALKWADLVDADTPIPTPWNKKEYEERSYAVQEKRRALRAAGAPEEELEALFEEERELFTPMLAESPHAGKVGAFEGGGYQQTGLYRPSTDCIMFTRDKVGFCAVCRRGLNRIIDLYTQ